MKLPRIVIAAERSDAGKSTLVVGILLALKKRGFNPQPFKAGPDFLDPMHHSIITERISRNLDTWMFPDNVKNLFIKNAKGADISIIEGVMGLYDGVDGINEQGSTSHLAKLLDAPVILILDAKGSARSMGAVALGFKEYDKKTNIAGVIFNKVGSEKHLKMLETSLKDLESLGGVPRAEEIILESRHLGLVPAEETYDREKYENIAALVEQYIDIDRLVEIANEAPDIEDENPIEETFDKITTIGVAYDKAFNFYYQDNIDLLSSFGAEIEYFSPCSGDMPDVDGLYLGGGYPELYTDELAENKGVIKKIRKLAYDGMPIYAECGGMIYLCEKTIGFDGTSRKLANVFDATVEMSTRLKALSYVVATANVDTPLQTKGMQFRGHEFHYSFIRDTQETDFAYELQYGKGISDGKDGFYLKNTLASYTHIHYAANTDMAKRFIEKTCSYSRR